MEVAMSQIRGEMTNSIVVRSSPCVLCICTQVDSDSGERDEPGRRMASKVRVVVRWVVLGGCAVVGVMDGDGGGGRV